MTIELRAEGDSTIVTLTHSGLPPNETDLHRSGWDHYIGRLAGVSEGRDVGIDSGIGET